LFDEGAAEPPNCADVGVLGVLPGIVGAYQASEAVKLITGIGELLSGKLLMLNTLTNTQRVIKIKRRAGNTVAPNDIRSGSEYHSELQRTLPPALNQWLQDPAVLFLDVRDIASENSFFPPDRTRHIPLNQLAGYVDELPQDKTIVVFCDTGRTSRVAVQLLTQQYGFTEVENLEGGMNRLTKSENKN
jgi:adenylyltransferase/sulfurtransferase